MKLKHAQELNDQLAQGAFLTVRNGDVINTMTIGWGSIGIMWGKPVLMVPVRYSRFTYELLQNADEFTVSVPKNGTMKKELAFAGSKSGREVDKFESLNLTKVDSKTIDTPVIGECELHYECKVVYKDSMEPNLLDSEIDGKWYPNHNYHVLFYGEILAEYK